ncbi:NACHT domain-containing protein [Lasiosphaeria ovina]|uniref:NACHT domain-containing protein n=1 Tax=Lasiosphaeria ovina TaxID=92902 RepID=A0AAE0KFS8_9PEZI|nr:NACHT domain-containing protein [Lasiosphaeria ovina]
MGKTMLLCGMVNELQSTPDLGLLSFFFCQATDWRLNNAVAVLRGLIFLLVDQQPSLIVHVRPKSHRAEDEVYWDVDSWIGLVKIFTAILTDPNQPHMCLIIDALDECVDLTLLVELVFQTSSACPSVTWIISSRNTPSIKERLDAVAQKVGLSLGLSLEDEGSVSEAITEFVRVKVQNLTWLNEYDNATRDAVERYLQKNACGNFLWISLVCQELENTPRSEVQMKLAGLPNTIMGLYGIRMNRLRESDNYELYKKILAVFSIAENPITLGELVIVADTFDGLYGNRNVFEKLLELCSPFLTIHERTVSIAHLSAKEYLLMEEHHELFSSVTEADLKPFLASKGLGGVRPPSSKGSAKVRDPPEDAYAYANHET